MVCGVVVSGSLFLFFTANNAATAIAATKITTIAIINGFLFLPFFFGIFFSPLLSLGISLCCAELKEEKSLKLTFSFTGSGFASASSFAGLSSAKVKGCSSLGSGFSFGALIFLISFNISSNSSESGILMLLSLFNIHIVPYTILNFTIFL